MHKRVVFRFLCLLTLGLILYSCASIGNPSGGPRDERPPRPVRFNPPAGAVNVSADRIEIEFDELVNVKDAFTKVVVSPAQKSPARVSSSGRKVIVSFTDTLRPNTTYTIDFSNSIEDNNEGNKIPSFSYTFSTGPEIDSLRISGMVLGARDLEPQKGMLVGVYKNFVDSMFRTTPFHYMAKTDDYGRFSIRGLAPGDYRLFALGDVNNDYRWDNPEEELAFLNVSLSPSAENVMVNDTIYNMLTGAADSVRAIPGTRYLPDDILLSSFKSDFKQQYITKSDRPDSLRLSLIFNNKNASLPVPRLLGRHEGARDWYIPERSLHNDTITYWITEPTVSSDDSLKIAVDYLTAKFPHQETIKTDTLDFLLKKRVKVKKEKEDKKKSPAQQFMPAKLLATSGHDIFAPVILEFDQPPVLIDSEKIHLEQQIDTVWTPLTEWKLERADTLNPRRFRIDMPLQYGAAYRLRADSLAVTGLSGLMTNKLEQNFSVKKEDDYASLTFNISGLPDSIPAVVELLQGDNPVRTVSVANGKATFTHILPGIYYARLYLDANGNGIYDVGDWDLRTLPEDTYYYPKRIKVKKFWDMEQTWDINSVTVDMQKPLDIRKNKPESRSNRSEDIDEEDEEEIFDPTANPFDPNEKKRRKRGESATRNMY